MALNPTFASASVNPSQSIGSDASAPQQGALPTGMPQNFGMSGLGGQANQPQYTMWRNEPSAPDVSENAYQRYAGQQTLAGGATQQYGDWANSQVYGGIPMNYQPTPPPFMPQGNMPQIGQPLGQFNPATTLPDGTRNSEGGSYEYPQAKPLQSFFEGSTKGQVPAGMNMVNGEMYKQQPWNHQQAVGDFFSKNPISNFGDSAIADPDKAGTYDYDQFGSRWGNADIASAFNKFYDTNYQYGTQAPAPRYIYLGDDKTDYSQLGLSQSALDSFKNQPEDVGRFYYDTQTKTFGAGAGYPGPNIPGQRRYIGKSGIPLELMNKLGGNEYVDFSKYAQYDEGTPVIQPQDVGQLPMPEQQLEPTSPLAPMQQDFTNPSDFEGLTFAETNNFNDMPMFHYDQDATREQKLRNEAPYMTRQNYINNLNNIRRPVDESGFGSTGRITQPVQQPQVLTGVTGIPTSPLTPTATTGTPPMATNPLSTYATTPTTGSTPAPTLNATPGASSSGNFGQGGVLPNVTTTQQQVTAAPSFYTDYLNQLATKGGQAAENAQYVGAQPLQEQAFNLASQNVGNYQPTLQNAINLASSVGNTNLAQAIGDVGQANIARNLAPQATAGIVGSGQFGSKRGAQALGDVIANAELGLTAQQQAAMQQDMANRIAAAQQLGTLANSTQQLGLGDVNALSTLGQQQQTIAQNQQLFPMQQLANQSALLRGYTIPTSVSASQTGPGQQGQFQTSPLQQIMSVGTLLGALSKPTADYIDPKTGLLVKGTSAGGNLYGGLESLIKRFTGGTYTANPSTNTTTSTTVGDVSASMKTLPDGRPNPNYDAYADPNATDEDRMAQNLLNGGYDRSNPTSYDEIGSGGYPSNIDEN